MTVCNTITFIFNEQMQTIDPSLKMSTGSCDGDWDIRGI